MQTQLNHQSSIVSQTQHKYILQQRLSANQISQLNNLKSLLQQFLSHHHNKTITCLTSGGTSVPLEKNAVRFIQNFSTGLRGSKIAQIILDDDQPLIYFYRDKSFLPYQNGFSLNQAMLSENQEEINQIIKARQMYRKKKNQLLLIPFNSIYMYLNGIIEIKKHLPDQSIIILCAAVSDFIPKQVPTHKITTSQQLQLELQNSPKILGEMISPNHLCVSFKLQTDQNKLGERIQFAIKKYNVDMVIGNVLGNKNWIHIQYNQKRFGNKQFVEHSYNVEKNIWMEIFKAHKQLFYNQN